MSAYVRSTDVNLAQNSKFIQVNDSATIGNIREGWPVAINGIVIGFAKVVNTSAAPPTIELYETYTGSAITGGVLLTFPSQGQLTVIGDRITALTNTYEALASSVSIAPSANSVVKRDAGGKVKTANAVDANDAVALGQFNTRLGTTGNLGNAATRNVGTATGNVAVYEGNTIVGGLSAYGYGAKAGNQLLLTLAQAPATGFFSGYNNTDVPLSSNNDVFQVLHMGGDEDYKFSVQIAASGRYNPNRFFGRTMDGETWQPWVEFAMTGAGRSVSFASVTAASLNVTGSKNFRIDNPANPDEYLYHSAIESDKPRTQYVLHVDIDDSLEATVTLPDWFYPLNGNTCTVFCSPCKHFGAAYGEVLDGVMTITANAEGRYHVLIMAERSDPNVANWKLTELKPVEPIEEDVEQE